MLACALGLLWPAAATAARGDVRLRCESTDGQLQQCAADARHGVRLKRQLSKQPCVENESWGFTPEGVWVKHGCRADFLLGRGSSGRSGYAAQVVRCDSVGNRWNHCEAPTRDGVDIVRQRSEQPCIRGQSWGVDEAGIWVAAGCKADFRPRRAGAEAAARVVRCESRDARTVRCALQGEAAVRLRRQLSTAHCERGRSWDADGSTIWVSRGCRAEFELLANGN